MGDGDRRQKTERQAPRSRAKPRQGELRRPFWWMTTSTSSSTAFFPSARRLVSSRSCLVRASASAAAHVGRDGVGRSASVRKGEGKSSSEASGFRRTCHMLTTLSIPSLLRAALGHSRLTLRLTLPSGLSCGLRRLCRRASHRLLRLCVLPLCLRPPFYPPPCRLLSGHERPSYRLERRLGRGRISFA